MKCFYHKSDLDGLCSAAIVKQRFPYCDMLGVDYNDSLMKYAVKKEERIIVVDFSFEPEEMLWLHSMCRLTWIDHHKSSIKNVHKTIPGVRKTGTAACELAWAYYNKQKPVPEGVALLGKYDVWNHTDPRVLPFQYGIRAINKTLPHSRIWGTILGEDTRYIEAICRNGVAIYKYQQKQNEEYAKSMAYATDFEEYKAIVINGALMNSLIFDSVYNAERHDIMILFSVTKNGFKYSLYSKNPNIDVSKIAEAYGGGGHEHAAGFQSNDLLV